MKKSTGFLVETVYFYLICTVFYIVIVGSIKIMLTQICKKKWWKLTGNNEKQALEVNATINHEKKKKNTLNKADA